MMDNCIQATKQLLTALGVKHTSKHLKDSILSHPDYPSLLSVSDTLEKYQIETLAVKIDIDKLEEMPLPCIVQIEANRQPMFFVLKSVLENKVQYYDDKNKLVEKSKKVFLKEWTGICLLVETTEASKEKDINKKIADKKFLNLLKCSIAILLLSWIVFSFINLNISSETTILYTVVYTILKAIGFTAGIFLLWFDIDQYNPTLQSFCKGGTGSKINCNAVLGSKHAKLLGGNLSLSLLSFSYFFGTLTYLLIYGFSTPALTVLGVLSFISAPIVAISIYYQAFVIKQWCKFCIVIQGVLVGEIVITFFIDFYKNPLVYESLPLLLALLLIPMLVWKLLKPLLEQEKEINLHKRGLKKIKNNPDVFEGLLIKSRKIETSTEGLGISILNKGAKYYVVKVCNPYCGPCAKAHAVLEDLVKAGKINLQILFTANSIDGHIGKPVGHFLAIDEQGDKKITQQALDDWYLADKKDYEIFSKKYPMNGKLALQSDKIKAMYDWCKAEHIVGTPTLFINDRKLPKEYIVEDLSEVLQ